MVSILIPVYNYNVTKLVLSLKKEIQEKKICGEIIIADDCSTNQQLKSLSQSYKEHTFCQVFEFSENKGRTYTRNFLAEKAQYDWLLFLDADVQPKYGDFIYRYISKSADSDLVFGGISYAKDPPSQHKILRWKYGRKREAKSISERKKNPYLSIISMGFFIRKKLFLKTNPKTEHAYGMDVLFSENLKRENARIQHIDNPVIHQGVESNEKFIEKTKEALITIHKLEQQKQIPPNFRPIQNAHQKLKKIHLNSLFSVTIGVFESIIKQNLLSKNPSLFLFDLYKLYFYNKLE